MFSKLHAPLGECNLGTFKITSFCESRIVREGRSIFLLIELYEVAQIIAYFNKLVQQIIPEKGNSVLCAFSSSFTSPSPLDQSELSNFVECTISSIIATIFEVGPVT